MKNEYPVLVSLCIPTYNQTVYLRKTLESVLMQDISDYEIIVTDDSTTDEVRDLLFSYDFGDKLKYFKNEQRKGTPENWNYAVSHAKGEYIKIMLHDDWFSQKDSLSCFIEALENNPQYSVAFSNSNAIDLVNNSSYICRPPDSFLRSLNTKETINNLIVGGNFIGAPSAIMYRNKNYVFDPHLRYLVDTDFYIMLIKWNEKIYHINKTLINIGMPYDRVTKYCADDPKTEIYELVYLIHKNASFNIRSNISFFIYIVKIFSKYKITSMAEIRKYYHERIPVIVFLSLGAAKILQLTKVKTHYS